MLDQQGYFVPSKTNWFYMLHEIALYKGYENRDRANLVHCGFLNQLFATCLLFVHHKVSCFTNTRSGYGCVWSALTKAHVGIGGSGWVPVSAILGTLASDAD